MPRTTTRGITSPDGTGGWDLADDLQALAQSADDAVTAAVNGLPTRSDLAAKADAQHTHTLTDVTGLVDALAAKANTADLPAAGAQDLVGTQSETPAAATGWAAGSMRVQRLGKHHAFLSGACNPTADTGTSSVTMATLPSWAAPKNPSTLPVCTGKPSLGALPATVNRDGTVTIFLPSALSNGTPVMFSHTYPLD